MGVSRQNINNKIKHWMDNQNLAMWRGPCRIQTQARKLISGPSPATKARLLSCNRTQSRVVTGLLTGHNTLRRQLYVMGLSSNSSCRKCGRPAEEEPQPTSCVRVRPWLHSDMHIWVPSFCTMRILWIWLYGPSRTLAKEQVSFNLVIDHGKQRACFKA